MGMGSALRPHRFSIAITLLGFDAAQTSSSTRPVRQIPSGLDFANSFNGRHEEDTLTQHLVLLYSSTS
jgi:hypothetical protein